MDSRWRWTTAAVVQTQSRPALSTAMLLSVCTASHILDLDGSQLEVEREVETARPPNPKTRGDLAVIGVLQATRRDDRKPRPSLSFSHRAGAKARARPLGAKRWLAIQQAHRHVA